MSPRPPRRGPRSASPRSRATEVRRTRIALAVGSLALATACAGTPAESPGGTATPTGGDPTAATESAGAPDESDGSDGSDGEDAAAPADPDAPTGWGPTESELAQARAEVADWELDRLAGQVIVGRYYGTDPSIPAEMVERLHLAGVSVTAENAVDEAQVRATTAAVSEAVAADGRDFPAVIGVDEEGGVVSHLRGIATGFPAFAEAGERIEEQSRTGRRVVREAAAALALELRDLGFTWVFAPVADVTIGSGDVTIGSRSPSTDPEIAAEAVSAAVAGYDDVGVVATVKHFPGHGGVTADSHLTLPELGLSRAALEERELVPFRAAAADGATSVMMSHIAVDALAPGRPASIASRVYRFLREDVGFEGVAITDSMGMGAVSSRTRPVMQALRAGADLVLMPIDSDVAHATIVSAVEDGTLSRERLEDAAAKVVALQRWQQRVAEQVPVPEDLAARVQEAAAALDG
ncbi:glycosyl hyrolase family 3 [Nocardioidaceae bacterium]|nr:glycosyl hyrolase family 3 [Nocardioidaceae bacterium]